MRYYVLQRIEDGKYVNIPGSKYSYTKDWRQAQKFRTAEAAKNNACGNERVIEIFETMY